MDAFDLIKFLGHSSIYEPFDDFLTDCGVKKRPDVTGKHLDLWLKIKQEGLYISFETDIEAKENGIHAKSDGGYVFSNLDIYIRKYEGMSPYTGPLPFNLLSDMSQQQVRSVLGNPKFSSFDPEWKNNTDFFFVSDLVVATKFSDMEGSKILIVSVRVPSNWDREHGIAPVL